MRLCLQVKVTRDNVIDEMGASVPMISTDVLMGIDEVWKKVVKFQTHYSILFFYMCTVLPGYSPEL